tara:strand:+ start:1817 stop:2587 length:771 start_codon:yes stop_codon:yes gene_type:complete
MKTEYFVKENSIVREIWGKSDTILFIFAGASAEFALNKAVDWLYYTGKLPQDPLGRLFSTIKYAREIVFSSKESAFKAIEKIKSIHSSVENKRGTRIPDWAYRDVLFMLIDYSIRSFEILERPLSNSEKLNVYDVFFRMGTRMNIKGLPNNFQSYKNMREIHLERHLCKGEFTLDLFKQYRKHLGFFRYHLLVETQTLIVPLSLREMLGYRRFSLIAPLIILYKLSRKIKLDERLRNLILPNNYKFEIQSLDRVPV